MRKFLLLILLLTNLAYAQVEVTLFNDAVVDSEYVKLEDIAELSGKGAERIGKVFLGPSPRSGSSMKVLRSDIMQRLKGMGLDNQVAFAGSLGVSVSRGVEKISKATVYKTEVIGYRSKEDKQGEKEAQSLNKDKYNNYLLKMEEAATNIKIKDAVKRYVCLKFGKNLPLVVDIKIRNVSVDGEAGEMFTVEGVERGDIPGRCVFAALSCDQEGNVSGYATVEAYVDLEVDAQVLGRRIARGNCVRRQDIVVKRIKYKPGMNIARIEPEQLDGRVALRSLRAGVPLSMAYFGDTLDVRKGQMVTVCVVGNGFTIKEMALALADGSVGDTIKVESVVSKSVYPVRVTGPNQVDMPMASL